MLSCPKPIWKPDLIPEISWIIKNLRKYLGGKHCSIFKNGTCVVWPESIFLNYNQCSEVLLSVAQYSPEFKVRENLEGDFFVTFRGGVGGVVPGEMLRNNFATLKSDAINKGMLPHEVLIPEDGGSSAEEADLIAGLYVRARLYMDAECPVVIDVI